MPTPFNTANGGKVFNAADWSWSLPPSPGFGPTPGQIAGLTGIASRAGNFGTQGATPGLEQTLRDLTLQLVYGSSQLPPPQLAADAIVPLPDVSTREAIPSISNLTRQPQPLGPTPGTTPAQPPGGTAMGTPARPVRRLARPSGPEPMPGSTVRPLSPGTARSDPLFALVDQLNAINPREGQISTAERAVGAFAFGATGSALLGTAVGLGPGMQQAIEHLRSASLAGRGVLGTGAFFASLEVVKLLAATTLGSTLAIVLAGTGSYVAGLGINWAVPYLGKGQLGSDVYDFFHPQEK